MRKSDKYLENTPWLDRNTESVQTFDVSKENYIFKSK